MTINTIPHNAEVHQRIRETGNLGSGTGCRYLLCNEGQRDEATGLPELVALAWLHQLPARALMAGQVVVDFAPMRCYVEEHPVQQVQIDHLPPRSLEKVVSRSVPSCQSSSGDPSGGSVGSSGKPFGLASMGLGVGRIEVMQDEVVLDLDHDLGTILDVRLSLTKQEAALLVDMILTYSQQAGTPGLLVQSSALFHKVCEAVGKAADPEKGR